MSAEATTTIENVVKGPEGWTDSLELDAIGTLIRLGILVHIETIHRKTLKRRTFVPVGSSFVTPYHVNADPDAPAEATEQVMG